MKVDIYNTNNKYKIIYADPPWQYRVWSKKGLGRSAESHYNTMNIQDIINMKDTIKNISDKDSVLFLWVTFPCLKEGIKVLEEWGYTYKTCAFAWVKKNKKSDSWFWGMGYWTRANVEICLLGTKGNIKRKSAGVHQVIDTPIEEQSKKPNVTRDRIIDLVGDLPKIELFARQEVPNWDSWGNEI